MTTVLGIDAAWTSRNPSGVALIRRDERGWRSVAVAPSYDAFCRLACGEGVVWSSKHHGTIPNVPALLAAARSLSGAEVDVVTIDMPVARVPITARRRAESEIGRAFGARHCACHSPSAERPGPLGATITAAFADAGYPVAGTTPPARRSGALVEVYPHPALLTLLGAASRVPYKHDKRSSYWPDATRAERSRRIRGHWNAIRAALDAEIDGIAWPPIEADCTGYRMKQIEDALDAVVCAWVGACYVEGLARPFGDETAAIWCPTARLPSATRLSA